MKFIFNSSLVSKEAKKLFSIRSNIPTEITSEGTKPFLDGHSAGWETNGGTWITYPSAYSKKGWSNMNYCHSTRHIKIPYLWAKNLLKETTPQVTVGDYSFFVKKKALRRVERTCSKYEKFITSSSEDKYPLYITSLLSIISNDIILAPTIFNLLLVKRAYYILGMSAEEITKNIYKEPLLKEDSEKWLNHKDISPKEFIIFDKLMNLPSNKHIDIMNVFNFLSNQSMDNVYYVLNQYQKYNFNTIDNIL
jgi:hypothetical protein